MCRCARNTACGAVQQCGMLQAASKASVLQKSSIFNGSKPSGMGSHHNSHAGRHSAVLLCTADEQLPQRTEGEEYAVYVLPSQSGEGFKPVLVESGHHLVSFLRSGFRSTCQQDLQASQGSCKLSDLTHKCLGCRQRVSPDSSHAGISRQNDRQERAKQRRERRRKRKEYYQKGLSTGQPATCMLYKLADALRLEDNHLLW